MEKKKKKDNFWSNVRGLFWALLIALAIRSLVFEPYNIPSSSMVPTLLIGDYLFVSKYDYGYSRHSFPLSIPLIPRGRIFATEPQRGDIVVFKLPTDNKTDYIKRIIGLPGDRIQMVGGRLYINDKLVEREKIAEEDWVVEVEGLVHYTKYRETLPNGVQHVIYEQGDNEELILEYLYTVTMDTERIRQEENSIRLLFESILLLNTNILKDERFQEIVTKNSDQLKRVLSMS